MLVSCLWEEKSSPLPKSRRNELESSSSPTQSPVRHSFLTYYQKVKDWIFATTPDPEHLDTSYLFLRKCIGVIGIALPFVLVILTVILGNSFVIQDSISSYYYTVTRNIFVGSLCATAIFLISYRYENLDNLVSTVAGAFAIGVALFPTDQMCPKKQPMCNVGLPMAIGWAHGVCAVCFITSLAIMALIFRKSDKKNPTDRTPEKLQRNMVYLLCSITIYECVVLLILIAVIQNLILPDKPWLPSLHPILLLECFALWAFGFAWFVKGETIWKDKDESTIPEKKGTPATGGMRNSKTRVVASILGFLAGLLGLIHGVFEILQVNVAPSGVFIRAMGPPFCQANSVWPFCFPAMTIIPNFFATGVLAIIVSFIVLVWAAAFVQKKNGGLVLIVLSIIQLLVGGGYISPIFCFIAGVVGTRIKVPSTWWRVQLSDRWRSRLAKGWPWSFVAFAFWLAVFIFLGYFFNEFMLIYFTLGLLLLAILTVLTVLTGFAYDIQRQAKAHQAPLSR